MATPISAVLSGTLTGATQQGALTPIPLAFVLDAQTGHQQGSAQVNAGESKTITLPTNLGGPVATPDAQTLFLLTCDVGNVNITLNGTVGPFNFKKSGGVMVIPGQINSLPVSTILIANNGTQRATVSASAIFGA